MAIHRVNCLIQKNENALTIMIAPFVREVKDKNPTVVWEAGHDTHFPEGQFFNWKVGGPGRIPTRSSDGKTLTLNYEQSTISDWSYEIFLQTGEFIVNIDPDIHNDPPGGMYKE
jgi:hypothetical protein